MRRLLLPVVISILLAVVAVFLWHGAPGFSRSDMPKSAENEGAVHIGGDYQLIDQQGAVRSSGEFKGRYQLVYFGYTFCPDVCPIDLQKMSHVMALLKNDASTLAPIFITVDPARDTVAHLATVMSAYDPRITALTGSDEEIQHVAGLYKAYYAKAGDAGDTTDYLMDHSAFMYLMDPDGRYVMHFPHEMTSEEIADFIIRKLAADIDHATDNAADAVDGAPAPSEASEQAPEQEIVTAPSVALPLAVDGAWVRATAAPSSAAYMTLRNTSDAAVVVKKATAALARVEMHESSMEGGIMRMQPIERITLQPGEVVALAPGGMHIMLMGLTEPLAEGDVLMLTLHLADPQGVVSTMDVDVPVRAGAAMPAM